MKIKPDDYYNDGLFEIARFGTNIVQRNIMSPAIHKQLMENLVESCPRVKSQIDQLVKKISGEVLMCNPLQLLSFAQLHSLSNMIGITSESQRMGMEYVSAQRMVEYIQSIYVSCPNSDEKIDGDPSELFLAIIKDISDLCILVFNYYVANSAVIKEANTSDEEYQKELFQAQLMYLVRGNRYQYLEKEYYEQLLSPHSQEFESLFRITADEIVSGIEQLQFALSQGRFDPFNSLIEIFNACQGLDEEKRKSFIHDHGEDAYQLLSSFFGTTLNDVCSITGWPESFVQELSFGLGADTSFFEHPEYPGWPIIDLPIQKRPFIEIEGKYYCFDYYSFVDNFYRTLQKTITRIDNNYDWNGIQKTASEKMVSRIFQTLLPGCTVYCNNYYPKGSSKKQLCENDIIVVYCDVAIIVEVKAGSFVYTAPIADYEQHIKSYKKLIEEPDLQCKRTFDYLLSHDVATLYTECGEEKAHIVKSDISDIYMVSVTIDNINVFASKAEKLSFLKLQCEAISIAVDDLMVYEHYFDSPLIFLHFLKQRRIAATVAQIATDDELDHLGLYIKHNCYSMNYDGADKFSNYSLLGYRQELDEYFGKLFHPMSEPSKPEQNLPLFFKRILSFLEKSNLVNKIRISNYLLDFSIEAKEALCTIIENTLRRQRETHSYIALSTAGRVPKDLRYTCFVNQPGIKNASETEQADYVMSTILWNEDEERVLLCFSFNDADEITNIAYRVFRRGDIQEDRVQELFTQGKERAEKRVAAYKQQHRKKIGRNEDCPCGSGKKYKKCCGR